MLWWAVGGKCNKMYVGVIEQDNYNWDNWDNWDASLAKFILQLHNKGRTSVRNKD